MNIIDIIILVILALTVVWGYRTGLIHVAVWLVAIVLGLIISTRAAVPLGGLFAFVSPDREVQAAIGFVALFLILMVGAVIASNLLRSVITSVPLTGLVNNVTGAVIGLVVGCVLVSGIMFSLREIPCCGFPDAVTASPLGNFLADWFDVITLGFGQMPRFWEI